MRRGLTVVLGMLTMVVMGCSADSGDGGGTAPTTANLTVQQSTVPVGTQTNVNGSMDFTDPDGDVKQLLIDLTADGQTTSLPPTPVNGAAGITMGSVPFILAIIPQKAGTIEVSLTLEDAAGNRAAPLKTTLTAE